MQALYIIPTSLSFKKQIFLKIGRTTKKVRVNKARAPQEEKILPVVVS